MGRETGAVTPAATPNQAGTTRRDSPEAPLLEVRGLRTYFDTPQGVVRAVDGVSFALARGKTLGIVGESGSGKTVLSRSIMNLLPRTNVIRQGEILFDGTELTQIPEAHLRKLLGARLSMVFQDPMTSLHPVMKVGKQIGESLQLHLGVTKAEA